MKVNTIYKKEVILVSEYDGEIRIKASIDADKIDEELQKLSNKLERQSEAVNRQSLAVEKLKQKYQELASGSKQTPEELGILKQLKNLDKQIDILEKKIHSKSFATLPYITQSGVIKQFDELTEKSIKLREQLEKIKLDPKSTESMKRLAQEIETGENKTKRLNSELRQTENEFIKLSNQKSNNFTKKIDEASNAIRKIGTIAEETGKKSQDLFSKMGEAVSGFGSRIMRLAGAAFVFNIISAKLMELSEHFSNLIAQDNQLMSSLNQVRANLLTAFMPIWQAILPALQALGRALAWVTSHIAAFVSMLFGKSVQQSAAKNYINTSNALVKQAKGYEKVGKAAKKAAGELASFDKIEVLKQKDKTPKNNQSSGGGSNLKTPEIISEFKNIDTSIIDKVKYAIERLKKPFENMNLEPLREQFARLWEILQRFGGKIGEGLWWFYENVLAPLAIWTISEYLPRFLNLLSNALEALEPVFDQVGDDLKWFWNDFLKPSAEWAGSEITEFLDKIAKDVKSLGENIKKNQFALDAFSAFIIGLGTSALLVTLALGIWGLVSATWAWTTALLANPINLVIAGLGLLIASIILCVKYWDKIKDAANEAWEKMKQAWENVGKWFNEKVGDPLRNLWNGVTSVWKGAINGTIGMFEGFVNRIIGGINILTGALNKIGFDVPDWLGGGHFGINIPKI